MKRHYAFYLAGLLSVSGISVYAETITDVTDFFLKNSGFDSNFNYEKTFSGNVAGDIINEVSGWNKDMTATYTVAGTFEYGADATFNSSSKIPSAGYDGSQGGGLAFSTGWGNTLNYSQDVELVKGTYSLVSVYYNAGTVTAGKSNLSWIPSKSSIASAKSTVSSFKVKDWTADTINFTITELTEGKIHIGFNSKDGVGSGSSAKIIADYVKILYHGIDKTDLETKITEAENFYNNVNGVNAEALLNAINKAKEVKESADATMTDVLTSIKEITDAIYNYKLDNATSENPLSMTHMIVNPSFESGFDGWENSDFVRQSNNSFSLKNGTYYIEKWTSVGNKVGSASVSQTINGLPNGKYRMTVASGNIQQSSSNNQVNSGSTPQTGAYIFANYFTLASDAFKNRSLEFFVTNNEVTIGYKAENATGNWIVCDNFRLDFVGFDINEFAALVRVKNEEVKLLLDSKMQDIVRTKIEEVTTFADNSLNADILNIESLDESMIKLMEIEKSAVISIKGYEDLQKAIDNSKVIYADGEGLEADVLKAVIDAAEVTVNNTAAELSELAAEIVILENAVLSYRISNGTGDAPKVITNTNFARGSSKIFGRCSVSGVVSSNILETGLCWSTEPNAKVTDNRSTKNYTNNGKIYVIENLEPSTVYYVRAYTISKTYAVGYGEELKIITIPRGGITYTLNSSVTSAEGHHERIAEAMSSAVDYWNDLTSIKGHHLSVNYNAGTPTAEASYGGYMQFGASSSYQKTGTAMHEMNHTIGVGQHSIWYSSTSPLRANAGRGDWLGVRANNVVKFFENNNTSVLTGDNVHMWPYGINGAHEDSGSEIIYIANSLISQAVGEDGLPPTGGFTTPVYTFRSENDTKYYIKTEEESRGLYTTYLMENDKGRLVVKEITKDEALSNDSAAWYVDFNPKTCYYTIRNVATGKYFSYGSAGTNGIKLLDKTPGTNEYFQMMNSRNDIKISYDKESFTTKSFWIIKPEAKLNPYCLGVLTTKSTTAVAFNLGNAATNQRWIFLTEDDVHAFENANPVINSISYTEADNNSVELISVKGGVMIKSSSDIEVPVYSVTGEVIKIIDVTTDSKFISLANGFYIINNQKVLVK